MVSAIVCQNNTDHRFKMRVRVEGVEEGKNEEKVVRAPLSFVEAQKTQVLYEIVRHSKTTQPFEIEAELILLAGDAAQPEQDASSLKLKQKLIPKFLKNRLELSLGSYPHDSLSPEQLWAHGLKTYEALWSLPSGEQIEVHYRFVLSHAGDSNVQYVLDTVSEDQSLKKTLDARQAIRQGLPVNMYLDEVYENQRGNGFSGKASFNASALLTTERSQWSNIYGQHSVSIEYLDVPNKSWRWVNEWRIDKTGDMDEDGWEYATSWRGKFSSVCQRSSMVRRRRWIRLRRQVKEDSQTTVAEEEISQITTFQGLVVQLEENSLNDASRIDLITSFLKRKGSLEEDEVLKVLGFFRHESNKLDCFQEILRQCSEPKKFHRAACSFKFFSHRRVLATEFDFELFEAGLR